MPGTRRAFSRRRSYGPRPIINSIKNQTFFAGGSTGAVANTLIAKAVNTPLSTVATDVSQGSLIKAVYITIAACGLGGTGVLNSFGAYFAKNPGDNLTLPLPFSVGTSNEKKFVFRQWFAMIMRNQDGNLPFHWEGWIPIPKRYQRMGTDDTLRIAFANSSALTGHIVISSIYKWYR